MESETERRRRLMMPAMSAEVRSLIKGYSDAMRSWQSRAAQIRGLALTPYGVGREKEQATKTEELIADVERTIAEYRAWRATLSPADVNRVQVNDMQEAMSHLQKALVRMRGLLHGRDG